MAFICGTRFPFTVSRQWDEEHSGMEVDRKNDIRIVSTCISAERFVSLLLSCSSAVRALCYRQTRH